MKIQVDGVGQFEVPDSFSSFSPTEQDAAIAEMAAQSAKGIRSSIAAEKDANLPTQSVQQFDPMGNPTGVSTDTPVAPQMPYGEQMANVARDTGAVAHTMADEMTFGQANKIPALIQSLSGQEPDYHTALKKQIDEANATGANVPGLNTAIRVGGAALLGPAMGEISAGTRLARAGYSFLPKVAGWALDAAGYGAAQRAGHVEEGTASDYGKAALEGAKEGAIVGAGLPAAGSLIGAGVKAAGGILSRVPGVSRSVTGLLSPAVTPEAVATAQTLGPRGMVADISPAAQGLAGGVASQADEAGNSLTAALRARQAETPQRLRTDIEANLGPAVSPVQLEGQLRATQRTASPIYQNALQGAGPVDTTGALAEVGQRLTSAPQGSSMRRALENVRTMMMRDANGVPVPVEDAATLLNVRHELDDLIEYGHQDFGLRPGASGGQGGPLGAVRNELDQALKQQVPGLRRADELYSELQGQREALEQGRKLFTGGDNAVWPSDLRQTMAQASPGEQLAMRQGARASVENAVGTSPYDLTALRRRFGDPLDWNRANASTVFGAHATDQMARALEREQQFGTTMNRAIDNSQTPLRTAASKSVDEASKPALQISPNTTAFGLATSKLVGGINRILGANAERAGAATRNELSGILQMSPQEAQDLLNRILANKQAAANRGQAITGLLSNPMLPRAVVNYNDPRKRR
jgi:hypothetical protein